MQPDSQRKYIISLILILAATFLSGHLLTGPLSEEDQVLAAVEERLPAYVVLLMLGVTIYGAHLAAKFLSEPMWQRKDDYQREVRWSLVDVLAMVLLFTTAMAVYYSLAPDVPEVSADVDEFSVASVLFVPAVYCVVLLFGIGILRQRGTSFTASMGLKRRAYGRLILIGVIAFLIFQPFRFIHTAAVVALFNGLGLETEAHPVVEQLSETARMDLKLSFIFSVGVSAPLFEEIFFRGFFYQVLRRHMAAWAAIVLTATLFASIHPGFFQAMLILPLGLLLTYLMEKTGSLIPSVVLHFLVNGTSLLLVLGHGA